MEHQLDTCVILVRKSNKSAKEDDFEAQEKKCRDYAARKGYAIHHVYQEAHSGKYSPMSRNVLFAAIDDIKEGRAKVLVIRDFDRLARTIEQTYAILFQAEQVHHGRVEAVDSPIDRESPMAVLYMAVQSAANQLERDRIHERFQTGRRGRAENLKLMGGPHPIYGYQWRDNTIGARTAYIVDPESGAVVKQIFEWVAAGRSVKAIAMELNRRGVLTPSMYAAKHHDTG